MNRTITTRWIAAAASAAAMLACAGATVSVAGSAPRSTLPHVGGANESHSETFMSRDDPEPSSSGIAWADLATPDDARARTFYEQLFGWTSRRNAIEAGEFTTFERDGRALASMYRLPSDAAEQGIPAHWVIYVSTASVDAAVARVRVLGGRVLVPPRSYEGFARIAVIADPTGAVLGLWQAECATTTC